MKRVISVDVHKENVSLTILLTDFEIVEIFNKLSQDSRIVIRDFLFEIGMGSTYEAFFYEDSNKSFFHLKDLVNYISEIKLKAETREFYIARLDISIDSMDIAVNDAITDFLFESGKTCENFLRWIFENILRQTINSEKLIYYLFEYNNQFIEVDEELNIVTVHRDLEAYRTAWRKA